MEYAIGIKSSKHIHERDVKALKVLQAEHNVKKSIPITPQDAKFNNLDCKKL